MDKEPPSGANKEKEKEEAVTVTLGRHAPATESSSLTIIEEIEEMLLRLGFGQTVAQKLMDDQGIDSPWIIASFSHEDITSICNIIRRPREPDLHCGSKDLEACSVNVQVDRTLLQGQLHLTCQQHICAAVTASMGAGIEEER